MILLCLLLIILSTGKFFSFAKDDTIALKATLPFLIIFSHYFPRDNVIIDHVELFGCYGVALFFFISGYGIYNKIAAGGTIEILYIFKKIKRLFLPLIVASVFYVAICYAVNEKIVINIPKQLQNGYIVQPINWFVITLIELYIISWIASKFDRKWYLVIVGVLTMIMMFTQKLVGIQSTYFMSDLSYVGGAFFYKYQSFFQKNYSRILQLLLYIAVTLIMLFNPKGSIYWSSFLLPIVTIPLFSSIHIKHSAIIVFLSGISYEIYLVQTSSNLLVSQVMNRSVLSCIIVCIVSIIIAFVVNVIANSLKKLLKLS